jgi:hypothetical protein
MPLKLVGSNSFVAAGVCIEELSDSEKDQLMDIARDIRACAEMREYRAQSGYIFQAVIPTGEQATENIFNVMKVKTSMGPYKYKLNINGLSNMEFSSYDFKDLVRTLRAHMEVLTEPRLDDKRPASCNGLRLIKG